MRGDGRIYKRDRSPFWWIAYQGPKGDGKRGTIEESTKLPHSRDDGSPHVENERKARIFLRDRVNDAAQHRKGKLVFQGPKQEKIVFKELLDAVKADYEQQGRKSLRNLKVHEKPLREFFGHWRALSIGSGDVDRYIAERRALGRANATINRELEILVRAFSLAVKQRRLSQKLYVRALPENNARQGFFEKDELDKILPHLPTPLDDMTRFAYLCGFRLGEILGLRWDNVDRQAREVRLETSKNGEGRVLPLDEIDWKLFEKLWSAREYRTSSGGTGLSAYVFHRKGKPIDEDTFGGQWRRARTKAKLPGKLFHDLRRTAARNMIRAGTSETVAMSITGHKTRAMFSRYNITSNEDKLQALRARRAYVESIKTESNVREGTFGKTASAGSATPSETLKGTL